jgi:predicted permease
MPGQEQKEIEMPSKLMTRLRALLRKSEVERELDEELRYHIEQQTEQNIRLGMNPEEARFAARKAFGGVEQAKERSRDTRGMRWIEELWQDLRYGARMLAKKPGFTLVAVITLALGIGANTAIFSVINAVLLRSLPYPESDRLVRLREVGLDYTDGPVSYLNFTDWRAQQTAFEHMGLYRGSTYNLTGAGEPLRLTAGHVAADVFAALRVQPVLGRVFTNYEDKPGGPPVVVLSHALWQSRFGGDPAIVNQTITLDGISHIVLGVMPAGFEFPGRVSLWAPVEAGFTTGDRQGRAERSSSALARLKPGVSFEQARAEMDAIGARLAQAYPDANKNRRVGMEFLLDSRVGQVRRALWILFGAVALVLLIACANVANLLLARATVRQREMAVRAALGASRWRIIRQLLSESVLLAAVGGAAGLLLAHWGLRLIVTLGQRSLPRVDEIRLDGRVLLFSAAMALLTGILFGLAPAWLTSRMDLQSTLKETIRSATGGRAQLRYGLIVAEIALTLMLLVSAGLLLRSFHNLQRVDPGFDHERVLTFRVNLPGRKYPNYDACSGFYESLLARLRALPGVQAASVASQLPLDTRSWQTSFLIEGRAEPPPSELPAMEVHLVGPDYFRVMGTPLLRGRTFTKQDNRDHVRGTPREHSGNAMLNVIIIDEEFARRHFANQDPIGQQVRIPWGPRERNPVMTVVGVVKRVREEQLSEQGGNVQAYLSAIQRPQGLMSVVIKTTVAPESLIIAARDQAQALDPEQPIYDILTLAEMRANSIAPQRLNLTLLGIFAATALSLAAVGIYGVMSYGVSQRAREIGIRMALGAQAGAVRTMIVRQGLTLLFIGIAIGLACAFALTRAMTSLLFEVSAADPLTFAGIPLLLMVVALLACWIPARRATKVDPIIALRNE